jgi:hypothetical protein
MTRQVVKVWWALGTPTFALDPLKARTSALRSAPGLVIRAAASATARLCFSTLRPAPRPTLRWVDLLEIKLRRH